MARNWASFPLWLKHILVSILFTLCLMRCASGIVVRLGDAGASYQSSKAHIATVRLLPRLLPPTTPSHRWNALPSLSLPLTYVVRQLPFLGSYSQDNTHSTSQHALSPSPPPHQLSPTPATPSNPRYGMWRDHSPLPYYPLSPSSLTQDNPNIPRNQQSGANLQYHQEVQLPPVQHQREIVRLPSPVVKKVVMVSKEKNVAGRPGIDYPIYEDIPQTSFSCKEQRYKGFFGDPETRCQAWHYCDFNGGQASFLCPNGTIFSQVLFTCDWWFNVQCNSTTQQYVINERLYKYIIPMAPSFPEDFQGPEVNQYLTLKFMELMQKERKKLIEKMNQKEKTKKPGELDDLELSLGDDELLSRYYLLQTLSNDLGTKEGRQVLESKTTFLPQ